MSDPTLDQVRAQAQELLRSLKGLGGDEDVARSKDLVETLRNVREYELMGRLAEAVSRRDPRDARNRRLYTQYLIDTGKVTAAIDLLTPWPGAYRGTTPSSPRPWGCLGRAYKRIFFDAGDRTGDT